MKPKRKPQIVTLTRVSTEQQDLERQAYTKDAIIRHFGLEEMSAYGLKITGTVVLFTDEYGRAMEELRKGTCSGMVVPELDRWFRLKLELLSKWAEQFAEYVRPFEVMSPDGKTAKLIYTTLASAEGDGSEQYYALDLVTRVTRTSLRMRLITQPKNGSGSQVGLTMGKNQPGSIPK